MKIYFRNHRLTANRMLRVKKVIAYISKPLGLKLDPECMATRHDTCLDKCDMDNTSQHVSNEGDLIYLEVLCNDQVKIL